MARQFGGNYMPVQVGKVDLPGAKSLLPPDNNFMEGSPFGGSDYVKQKPEPREHRSFYKKK